MAFIGVFKRKSYSDEELIALFKQTGNNNHVGELFMRYTHLVLAICMKYLKNEEEAKDASMQIFEKLLGDLAKHEVQNFQAWFHTYIRNFCLMELRKEKSKRNHQEKFNAQQPTFVESEDGMHPSDKELLETDITDLETAINQLKDEQKECIELFYLKGHSYDEVMQLTGFEYKKVKSHIQNGKRNLKILLEKR